MAEQAVSAALNGAAGRSDGVYLAVVGILFAGLFAGVVLWKSYQFVARVVEIHAAKVERLTGAVQTAISDMIANADSRLDRLVDALDDRAQLARREHAEEMKLMREVIRENNQALGRNTGLLESVATALKPNGRVV